MFVDGPNGNDHVGYPSCTTESGAPLADALLTVTSAVIILANYDDNGGAAIGFGAVAALFAGSAIHGVNATAKCRRKREKWRKLEPFRGFTEEPPRPKGGPAPGNQPFRSFALEPDAGPPSSADGGADTYDGGS
jgi:hypothetical protein